MTAFREPAADAADLSQWIETALAHKRLCLWRGSLFREAKSNFPEETHCQLVQAVKLLLPEESGVIFLGDGEFDSNQLQAEITATIHRTDRCDLSLFQLGLDLLEHFLNEALPIPVAFQMPVSSP